MDLSGVRALLLDVEGTTTPVEFVYEVLFPYARAHAGDFLERHADDGAVQADLARLRDEHAADVEQGLDPPEWRAGPLPAGRAAAVAYVHWLMDRDRKTTGLKSLQGKIWQEGYGSGRLRGAVFPDVSPAFERWRRQGREIAIFSSGSVLAQRLLFSSTAAGDLTRFIRCYFDTTTGAKTDADSYQRIAETLGLPPTDVMFLSDLTGELDAARSAGLRTALCVRREGPSAAPAHPVFHSLDTVCP